MSDTRVQELRDLRRWHSENTSTGGHYLPGALREGPKVRERIHALYWELVDAGINPDCGCPEDGDYHFHEHETR